MCAGHAVHTVYHTHQTHDPKATDSLHIVPQLHLSTTFPVETTALLETHHAKVVGKGVTDE